METDLSTRLLSMAARTTWSAGPGHPGIPPTRPGTQKGRARRGVGENRAVCPN
jgi:hypothetical protein